MLWLLKIVLNVATGVRTLLTNLSSYPGLGFLSGPAKRLDEWLSSYYDYLERGERAKTQLEVSRAKAEKLAKSVAPGGKKAAKDDSAQSSSPAGATPGVASPAGRPEVSQRPATTAADPRGTLMLDAFMQNPEVPSDLKQRWLEAAADRERQTGAEHARPAYYGTLMPSDRALSGEKQPLSLATPPTAEPLFSDTVRTESPVHDTTGIPPAGHVVVPGSAQHEAPAAQWISPSRAEQPSRSAEVIAGSQSPISDQPVPMTVPEQYAYAQSQEPFAQNWPVQTAGPRGVTEMYREEHRSSSSSRIEAAGFSPTGVIDEDRPREQYPAPGSGSLVDDDQPAMIPLAEREQQLARLEYVCQWLREARQPYCPVNGAMVLLPLSTIEAGPRGVVELHRAVKADLAAATRELKLRFPVTAMVVGLEEDSGFEELIRRVGPGRAKSQRFGHRFDVRAAATPSQLAVLCARISGVFEDWVYAIFRERGSVYRAGNSHLFGLLCKVRTQLQDRLVRILCGGFGFDPEQANGGEPVAFSGCYFAATGRTEDRRAFVQGVFDKLNEEQDRLEWTKEALEENRHLRRIGRLGILVLAACGVAYLIGRLMQ